ncbi:ATP-binding protein [Bacillus sp. J14TS2]|uniref:hybrid sensor histidine kinase/response regulator n=1 Tax=Bacillus sp. J14TS2 TaxID=2807188 RepID=UPI0035B561C8
MASALPNLPMKNRYILLSLVLFIILLVGARMLWTDSFHDQQHSTIKKGQLDLRDWHGEEDGILLLDGEWEFYPSELLMDDEQSLNVSKNSQQFIQVPGRWNRDLDDKKSTPYGFGSYRLRVHVDSEKNYNYSIRVPSVRSSSEVYVNGRLLAKSGQVGKTKDDYVAKNLPYSTTFTADENGIIEIVVQATNFTDARSGGIARSIKFGTEATIMKEMKLSYMMQLLVAVIFLMHAVYALILFFLGNREKQLLYFSLLVFCITLMNLVSNDEKLFHLLFNIGHEWDFRLANFPITICCYALLQCMKGPWMPSYWRKISPVYGSVLIGMAIITLFLHPTQIIKLFPVYYLLVGITLTVTIITVFKRLTDNREENTLLLFSLTAIIHHFIWEIGWKESGISGVHYPFDKIISIGCFASIWFKGYFDMHAETKELASTLQRMNDQKDQFLANTAHEFKNPLHSILNMSQSLLMREQPALRKESIRELETILSVGQRLTVILNDLLDVESIQAGTPRLQKKVISLEPIVIAVMDMLQFMVEVKSVKFVNQIPEDLPPVIADENRLTQVVFNLLHNAMKYTNEGEITIQAFVKEKKAYIVVSDTGIGMDKTMIQRLFHPYEQADFNETMMEGGFGLGLSISKQLIELHGGTLKVSSVLGAGSKFTFSLELADLNAKKKNTEVYRSEQSITQSLSVHHITAAAVDADEMKILASTTDTSQREMDTERLSILAIDDDPVNLQVLESILPEEEFDVITATSGQAALNILDDREWDLVVSDIMMPQMSGYELTRIIRERYSLTELPILLLTARSKPKDIQAGFLAGANDYVMKPVEALEIRTRIKALTTVKQVVQEQLQLESAWLQAQIQPHFLFNVFNSVAALSEMDLDKMRDLLNELSHFLRSKFQFQHFDEFIPIEEELSIVRSYLKIEQVRFGDRLQVVWEVDEDKEVKIPFLTIQPLVENAIRHGVMKRNSGGKVSICVSIYDTYANITVEDDGVGMEEAKLNSLLAGKANQKTGVGIINTDQRLKRHFGTGLHIISTPDIGTTVTFTVSIPPR